MEALPLREGAKRTKYPFRLLRYWWVYQGILDEARRLGRGPTIVDAGSEIGLLRSLAPPVLDARWIGLDRNVTNPYVVAAEYDELHECNLEQSIPLPDDSADIIVCSHILEHLRNPEDTLGESIRVVKRGGVLLIGSPVLPRPAAAYYQRRYNRELRAGKGSLGSTSPLSIRECGNGWPPDLGSKWRFSRVRISFAGPAAAWKTTGLGSASTSFWRQSSQRSATKFSFSFAHRPARRPISACNALEGRLRNHQSMPDAGVRSVCPSRSRFRLVGSRRGSEVGRRLTTRG